MTDKNRGKWNRLVKPKINRKVISKHLHKVEGVTIRHAHKFVIKRWSNIRDAHQHVVVWIIAMGLLIAAAGMQLVWDQQNYRTLAPSKDSTYAEAVLGPVDTLNPLYAKSDAEQSASYLLFSRLLNYDTTGHLGYDLATDVSVNSDKTIYTVSIRPNVKWHDGVKLTAKDVVFTVNATMDPTTRAINSGWSDVTVKAINDTTVQFTLKSTYAAFEHALTFPILPEHILGKISHSSLRENTFSSQPIGSGPFKINLVQQVDNSAGHKTIYLTRNDNYYKGQPKLIRFQLHVYDSGNAIIDALSNNEVNAATSLSSADLGRVNTKNFDVLSEPIQGGVYAILNTKSSLLSDVKIRSAMQLGTDVADVRAKLPPGTPSLYLPFTNKQLTGDVPPVPKYNKLVAEKILSDDGWVLNKNGVRVKSGQELKISVVTVKNSEFERVLEVLAGQWRALGIAIETQVVDPNVASQNGAKNIIQSRNYDVLLYQLDIGADPDVYAYWHSSQISNLNFANYTNVISDDALSSAQARLELNVRNAKYITFTKQWLADIPAIGLYQATTLYIISHDTHTFNTSNVLISPTDRYSDILNWSVGNHSVYKTP